MAARLRELEAPLVVIGDQKSPAAFDLEGVKFFSLADQRRLPFKLA
jgi:hypothetical protein